MSSKGSKRKRKRRGEEEEASSTCPNPKQSTMSALLKGQGSTKFADRWPEMKPVVLKLLKQEPVTRNEWQDLFWFAISYLV